MTTKPTLRYRNSGSVVIRHNGRESEPVSYQGIARLGEYYATSEYYAGVLPRLFTVKVLEEHEAR
jgi:hypothetical protein